MKWGKYFDLWAYWSQRLHVCDCLTFVYLSVSEWMSTGLKQSKWGDRMKQSQGVWLVTHMTETWTQDFSSLPMSLLSYVSIYISLKRCFLAVYTIEWLGILLAFHPPPLPPAFLKAMLCLFPFKSVTEGVLALCPLRADFPAPALILTRDNGV